MPQPKPEISEEILYQKYVLEKKSPSTVARELKRETYEMRRILKEYGFKIRTGNDKKSDASKLDLFDLYVNQKKSINEISSMTKSNRQTIKKELKNLGVDIRSHSEAQLTLEGKEEILNYLKDKDWLYKKYVIERKSSVEISQKLGCVYSTVISWLRKHNIEIRDDSESKIGVMIGDKHPNWKGGVTSLSGLCREYFETNIRDKIASRDGYTCQLCGKEHCVLHVHHIYHFSNIIEDVLNDNKDLDPIEDKYKLYKKIVNDEKFNDYSNMITYCRECHWYEIHGYTPSKEDYQQPS